MAKALNEMVSIYPAEVLCPRLADITDTALKERQFYKYLMTTFSKHANINKARCGEYFQKYAVYYRQKLLRIDGPNKAVCSVKGL